MKAKNAAALSTLRMLRSALKNTEIEQMKPLDEAGVLAAISREVKKLKDGLDSYVAGNRADLAEQAKAEIALLEAYLPTALTDDELRALVREQIKAVGATSMKDMGKVIGAVVKAAEGRADGTRVSNFVKQEIGVQ